MFVLSCVAQKAHKSSWWNDVVANAHKNSQLDVNVADETLRSAFLRWWSYDYTPHCAGKYARCHITQPNECIKNSIDIASMWRWVPSCLMADFVPDRVDALYAQHNASIYFVGDSLSRQMFNSLKMLMQGVVVNVDMSERGLKSETFTTIRNNTVHFLWSKYAPLLSRDSL